MKTRMIAVKDLVAGMVIADTVLSAGGKVLLGKNIVVSPRAIALLSMWGVSLVYIEDNDSINDNGSDPQVEEQENKEQEKDEGPSKVFLKFFQQYDAFTSKAAKSFNFVRDYKQVPIQGNERHFFQYIFDSTIVRCSPYGLSAGQRL